MRQNILFNDFFPCRRNTAIFFNINLLSKIPDNKERLIKIKRIKGKYRNNSSKWRVLEKMRNDDYYRDSDLLQRFKLTRITNPKGKEEEDFSIRLNLIRKIYEKILPMNIPSRSFYSYQGLG